MKPKIVSVPSIQSPIQPSPGFEKKELSNYKLDLLGLCQFGCTYCSTNTGYTHRIKGELYADAAEQQLGQRMYAGDDPALMMVWPEIIDRLDQQLGRCKKKWGAGKTLVFSMLTDGFSPELVKNGTTKRALKLVLERTSFRIRVLTKNAAVGSPSWREVLSRALRSIRCWPVGRNYQRFLGQTSRGRHFDPNGAVGSTSCAAGCWGAHLRHVVPCLSAHA